MCPRAEVIVKSSMSLMLDGSLDPWKSSPPHPHITHLPIQPLATRVIYAVLSPSDLLLRGLARPSPPRFESGALPRVCCLNLVSLVSISSIINYKPPLDASQPSLIITLSLPSTSFQVLVEGKYHHVRTSTLQYLSVIVSRQC
jgi:hypothetical protein